MSGPASVDERVCSALERIATALEARQAKTVDLRASVPFKWRCEKCTMWVMENEVHECALKTPRQICPGCNGSGQNIHGSQVGFGCLPCAGTGFSR